MRHTQDPLVGQAAGEFDRIAAFLTLTMLA
ncbi:MAG: hypothetical protein JWM63_1837 [Gammaproteobacteria bacterium]|jgi:hypothetical protein|nr:hypothetical protein [Gammaproteobacteria bacterium]